MTELTKREIAMEIEWLGGCSETIDFDSACWRDVNEDGKIILEGIVCDTGEVITVTLEMTNVRVSPAPYDDWDPDEDEQ